MEYYAAIKEIKWPFVMACIDLEGIMLNEISLIEKDKYCTVSFMLGI